jgi:hypothetical protein
MWPRRAVQQTPLTLGAEPGHPPVRTLAGDPQLLGHMRHRSAMIDHPLYQQTSTEYS